MPYRSSYCLSEMSPWSSNKYRLLLALENLYITDPPHSAIASLHSLLQTLIAHLVFPQPLLLLLGILLNNNENVPQPHGKDSIGVRPMQIVAQACKVLFP